MCACAGDWAAYAAKVSRRVRKDDNQCTLSQIQQRGLRFVRAVQVSGTSWVLELPGQ